MTSIHRDGLIEFASRFYRPTESDMPERGLQWAIERIDFDAACGDGWWTATARLAGGEDRF